MGGFANQPLGDLAAPDAGRTGEPEDCRRCDGTGTDGVGLCVECYGIGKRKYGRKES